MIDASYVINKYNLAIFEGFCNKCLLHFHHFSSHLKKFFMDEYRMWNQVCVGGGLAYSLLLNYTRLNLTKA